MPAFQNFTDLDDKETFVGIVKDHFLKGWPRAFGYSGTEISLDENLVSLAHDTYQLSINQYTIALKSQNPDHYKRAGALLHSLYKTKPIVKTVLDSNAEYYRDFNNVGVSYADAEHWDNYCVWFETYANFAMSFDLAFRCCAVYEENPRVYNSDFLENACYYMAENTSINVGSFMMIFKAFMA
ncbi:hypothetical protein GR268_35995 [Rhizobium leguminosarum]|nr:hypothetical protein [Rhizobium leguminosarum]